MGELEDGMQICFGLEFAGGRTDGGTKIRTRGGRYFDVLLEDRSSLRRRDFSNLVRVLGASATKSDSARSPSVQEPRHFPVWSYQKRLAPLRHGDQWSASRLTGSAANGGDETGGTDAQASETPENGVTDPVNPAHTKRLHRFRAEIEIG